MKLPEIHLSSLGIPQDIIDQAEQLKADAIALGQVVEFDVVALVKLCITDGIQAARDWLTSLASKLPSK